MRDPPSAAAAKHTNTAARSRRGRPRARESIGLMSRCKSAPDRFAAHLEQHETEDHEASWGPTATSSLTTGSGKSTNTSRNPTVGRALGQGTIDQYFTVKVKDERVETVRLPLSAGLPHRSTFQRPRTSRRREPPPNPTTSSTCRTVRGETNVAEQRDDTHNDTRIKKIVTTVSRLSPSSQESVGTNATSSCTVQGDPGNDESTTTCECTATKTGTTSADGSGGPRSVHLLKKGKYSTRLSRESQRSRENRSRSSEHQRMAYSCRTVLIPPGKVGAVLHTSPLGPSIKTIKPTSPIYDQIAVGDVVVEVDGIDTTSARAKEVTMMLINGAEGKRRIVVLRKETSDQDRSQDDGSSIEEDSPTDRYHDFQDDEKDDDDAAVLSASVASGATTVAAGNTQAHKRARKNLTKDLSTNAKIRSEYLDTIKGAYSATGAVSHIFEAAEEPIWEAPERWMDAETPHVGLLDANKSVESRRSAAMGEESFPPAPASELIANRSSSTPMTIQVKKYDSDDDDDEMLTSAISTTGSEISSLSGSAECSQFGVNCTIGPIVHDERQKATLSPIGETSTNHEGGQGLVQQSLSVHQDTYISMESQHDGVVPVITGEHESNAITVERTQPGFDLFLEGMGEETSTSLSTLTPSLADGGRDNQTEKSTEKSRKPSIGIRSESPWQNPLFADAKGATSGTSTDCGASIDSDSQKWAELTVLAASTVLSSGGTKQLAKRAADSVLSLCNESPTCVDFQSLASIVSLEILEASGDRVVASAVLGSILRYQKETAASKLVEDRQEDSVTSTNSLVLLPLPKSPVHSLLDVACISAKPLAKQNAKHHRFFQGTEAGVDVIGFVSLLSASRDAQIVQDALQFSSLLQQSLLAPRSTSTSTSIPEEIEEKPTAQQTPSHVGLERSFSTYQLCSRTLIAAEADNEVELFFPANDFEQLDRNFPLHVCIGQQDASAATNKDESKPQLVGIGPAKSLATAPTSNVADDSFAEGIPECSTERVPRSMLERWRSARRRQRAKARLRAVVKV